jgi:2-polyprenyl-3-methyl-5-hydroxy-6-metoxy-1,4-benzoquinol methylase
MSAGTPTIDSVRSFWEANPCGNETSQAYDRVAYFREVEHHRYRSAPFIPRVANFERFGGKRVLEIGCGVGTDGAQFALGGAEYVGVDLTEAAVELARENLRVRGLAGECSATNAESLPFPNASFDHVYSFGVIHHTPKPPAVIDEISRVLKPGGTVTVMLYNRTSINYYVEIMGLRRLGRALLLPPAAPHLIARLLGLPRDKLEGHRQRLLAIRHPTREQWISMNTDGPDCPLARVYSKSEIAVLFAGFDDLRTDVHHFDTTHWPFIGRLIGDQLAAAVGRRVGWCRMVYAVKPAA